MSLNIYKFKSKQIFYEKERENLKNNTVRKIDLNDFRFLELIYWNHAGYNEGDIQIEIVNADSENESFIRNIQDISIFDDLMIITWNPNRS